jgi:PhnB protein
MKANVYLNFDGSCREAFEFYAKTFGGKELQIMTFADSNPGANAGFKPEELQMVMHARFLAGETAIMGSDAPGGRYKKPQGFSVSLGVDTTSEAERIYGALSEGGQISMPMQETFFAQKFGMLTDRFGTPWIIVCEKKM